jgi:hypothetical protein
MALTTVRAIHRNEKSSAQIRGGIEEHYNKTSILII